MIALFKLITGEFVIGKKNDKDKIIEKPCLVLPMDRGFGMVEYYHGFTKESQPIPFHCIMIPDIKPRQQMIDKYSQILSPLALPKKKLIDLSMHKNLN